MGADGKFYLSEDDFVNNCAKHINDNLGGQERAFLMGQSIFKAIDANKNGTISHKEFANFCKAYNVPEDRVPEIFATIDLDRDGLLSKEEFMLAYASFFLDENPDCPYNNLFGPIVE